MAISSFGPSIDKVNLLGQASLAAFEGGPIPAGFTVVTPETLGIAAAFRDGPYFVNDSAAAIVLQRGQEWIVAFRGTDEDGDFLDYPQLVSGSYIDEFAPLLQRVAAVAGPDTTFSFTGGSLGGAATNLMAEIAPSAYGGRFADADFVAFASPNIENASGILNVGFENDPIYRLIEDYSDNPSSLDNLVLATSEYMAGNFDGRSPYDEYAHSEAALGFDGLARIGNSAFYEEMRPDSVIILDAFSGQVQDITPGRENIGAYYLGEVRDDAISGRGGNDSIEGFAGNDVLAGGGGADYILGGSGNDAGFGGAGADILFGGIGSDALFGNAGNDQLYAGADADQAFGGLDADAVFGGGGNDTVGGGDGNDVVGGGAQNDLVFGGNGNDGTYGGLGDDELVAGAGNDVVGAGGGNDVVYGGAGLDTVYAAGGNDLVFGGAGTDQIFGGAGNDTIWGGAGNDLITGGGGADRFVFQGNDGSDLVTDYNAGEGDVVDVRGAAYTTGTNREGDAVVIFEDGGAITFQNVEDPAELVFA